MSKSQFWRSCLASSFLLGSFPALSQTDNVKAATDTIVLLCGAGGERLDIQGSGSADGGIALKRLGAAGSLEIKLNKSEVRGLVDALNAKITALSADQATQARKCMENRLDRILDAMLPPKKTVAPLRPANCQANTTFQCAASVEFGAEESSAFAKSEARFYRFEVQAPTRILLSLNPMPNTRSVTVSNS